MIKKFIVTTLALAPVASFAVSAEECLLAYATYARAMDQKADRLQVGSKGMKYGGTTYGTSHGSISGDNDDRDANVTSTTGRKGMSSTVVLGGSSLGTTAEGYTSNAQFAANVAQSIAESRGQVAGPVTVQLASDLNAALYDWSRPDMFAKSLGRGTRASLRNALNDRRVTGAELGAATNQLATTGDLCDERGQALTQEAWAHAIVSRISGRAAR